MLNEREISILRFIRENPGVSLRKIIKFCHDDKIAAPTTVINELNKLEREKLIYVERSERRGISNKYFLTEKGLKKLRGAPKAQIAKKGLIKIGFSETFLKHLGSEEAAKKFLKLLDDPKEGKKLINLIGSQIGFYVENLATEPGFAAEYLKSLNRIFFTGSLPQELSKLIMDAIEFKVFRDETEAFGFVIIWGLACLKSALRGGLSHDPSKVWFTPITIKYDPKKGYINATNEVKKIIEEMPAEKVKQKILSGLNFSRVFG